MRRKRVYKKNHKPDAVHESIAVGRFINYLMQDGKKSTAEKIMYGALGIIEKKTKKEPMGVFEKALENVTPIMEVKSRRIGGANYQIPIEVRPDRKFFLASGWIIEAAKTKKGNQWRSAWQKRYLLRQRMKEKPLRRNKTSTEWPRRIVHLLTLQDGKDLLENANSQRRTLYPQILPSTQER